MGWMGRWGSVVGGALGCAVGLAAISNVLGIFTQAIAAEYHWPRAQVTLGLTILHIFSGISGMALGALITRFGVRIPTAIAATVCSIAVAGVGLTGPNPLLYYWAFALIGICGAATTALPYAVAISAEFDKRRGFALGAMVTGTGVGATLLPFLTNAVQSAHGWRAGFVALGLVMGVGSLLAILVFTRSPESVKASNSRAEVPSFFHLYLRTPGFWLIGLPVFLISLVVSGVLSNIVPIMVDHGLTKGSAVAMLSAAGLASWASRMGVGILLDRLFAPFVAAGAMMVAALGLAIILLAPGASWAGFLGAICIGFSLGAEGDLIAYLVSRYFPIAYYGKVIGAVWILWSWGNALGISVASYAHDLLGGYQGALLLFIGASCLASFAVARLGPYHRLPSADETFVAEATSIQTS